ncbi:hypothetical protein IW262DRAFT_1295657 [Armillaria fumosa]|nr:hypothetical protein IW262DRAFT_1295657 [Armillaria fumosa]
MNSPPPRHTWREFLKTNARIVIIPRRLLRLIVPAEEFIRQSNPDPTIVERILESFLSYLVRKGYLDDLLPINLDVSLHTLQVRLPGLEVDEPMIVLFHARLLSVVDMAVEALARIDAETECYAGDAISDIIAARRHRTHAHIQTTAIESKRPRVLFGHSASLQLETDYAPNVQQFHEGAMVTGILQSFMYLLVEILNKPFLDVASPRIILATVAFWIFFSGILAIIVEKDCFLSCLLTTTSVETTILPLQPKYEYIPADRCCVKGIPRLAILAYLHLPNESERSSASNRGASGVSVGTTPVSTISFNIEYPGMTRLPRLFLIAKTFSKRNFNDMKGAIVLSDAGKAFRGSTWEETGFSLRNWIHHRDLEPRDVAKGRDGNLRLLDYERSSLGGCSCSCEELSTLEAMFDSLADWQQ